MPVRAKPYGEHSEGFFFSQQPEIRFYENRTQDLLRARRYRAGLAISTARPFAIRVANIKYAKELIIPDSVSLLYNVQRW